jgi:hypothetical protein
VTEHQPDSSEAFVECETCRTDGGVGIDKGSHIQKILEDFIEGTASQKEVLFGVYLSGHSFADIGNRQKIRYNDEEIDWMKTKNLHSCLFKMTTHQRNSSRCEKYNRNSGEVQN